MLAFTLESWLLLSSLRLSVQEQTVGMQEEVSCSENIRSTSGEHSLTETHKYVSDVSESKSPAGRLVNWLLRKSLLEQKLLNSTHTDTHDAV